MNRTIRAKMNNLAKLNLPVAVIFLGLSLLGFSNRSSGQQPLKVFVLAGQSNMEGQGEIYANAGPRARGSLEYEVKNDTTGIYAHIVDADGKWLVREDVWIRYDRGEDGLKKGNWTVGYGSSDKSIGPEFQFGYLLGDYYRNQVLIIKTAWGGKSLGVDFRPPGSGGTVGPFYKKIIEEVNTALHNLPSEFPGYKNQGYELAGFVWNQGWNDGGSPVLYNEYEKNMVNFIRDIRRDLGTPSLPFVIANCGHGGFHATRDKWMNNIQNYIVPAQAAAAARPEFSGNTALVDDRPFWKDSLESPTTQVHHYNRNAGTFFMMGNAMGLAMIGLLKDKSNSVSSGTDEGQDANERDPETQINGSGLMGYISSRTSRPPAGYGAGIGFYSAVYPILPDPINDFQIGLASTWITPDNSENTDSPMCPIGSYARDNWADGRGPTFKDVFQTIEGGLGIWGSTQFRAGYKPPKFQIVGVPDCYTGNYIISPGWSNTTDAAADNKMGIAQLSNRILLPPDGITFRNNPHGELFGYSWMSLPLADAKAGPPPTGNRHWTLFLALSNFKGPVAFIIPETWSKISANYAFDYGRGLDNREGHSGGGAQEINTVPYFESQDDQGILYSKTPDFIYPVDNQGRTVLMQDIRYYSNKALADAVMEWRKGGTACSGKFDITSASSQLATITASPLKFHQTDKKILLTGFEQVVQTAVFDDSHAFGLQWNNSKVSPIGELPRYFKDQGKSRMAVAASEAPGKLQRKKFAAAVNGKSYISPATGAWTRSGTARGPFFADLADGSRVTYYWYRFIDQPSLQQYKNVWNDSVKSEMQTLIENIHRNWTINRDYMPAPADGKPLVAIDPALIVTPPPGLEAGYVPIVTKQEAR
ncbi:MAG: sialate O-acetylesterase [Chitinophagales bacterium]